MLYNKYTNATSKRYTQQEKEDIISKAHLMGHFSTKYMVNLIRDQGHSWPRMYRDCELYMSSCPQCNRFNSAPRKYHPVRPIEATLPFDHVVIDLHTMSVSSNSHVYIFAMIDVFTRFVWLRPLKDKRAVTIAATLWSIFSDFSFPRIIQSDNGTEFVNSVIKELCTLCCIDHRLITAYHPRADGIIERVMRELVAVICKMLDGAKTDWFYVVPQTQLFMNIKTSSFHGSTPFSVLFCRPFVGFLDHSKTPIVDLSPEEIRARYEYAQSKIFPAVGNESSAVASKRRQKLDSMIKTITDPYPDGSLVMVRDPTRKSKLDPKYFGPFTVLARTRGGTYTLRDMVGELYHRNVSPSQLKLVSGETASTSDSPEYVVEAIVDHRGYPNNYEYKIKWKGYPSSDNTWEPSSNLTNCQESIETYWKIRGKAKGF